MRPSLLYILAGVCLITIQAIGQAARPSQRSPQTKTAILENYGQTPLSFEANRGQTDPRVRFLSRGGAYSLFLTDKEAVLALRKAESAAPKASVPGKTAGPLSASVKTDVIRMQLAGAQRRLKLSGEDLLTGTANYFIGNDPARWHTNVPTYAKVRYADVYPGIDLVFYGNQQQLEYDFVIAPGVDLAPIQLRVAGTRKISLTRDGDLRVMAKHGEIAFHKPVAYQEIAGERRPVEGRFKIMSRHTVGFSLGNYDHARQVVIDPTLIYSTYLGGSGKLDYGDIGRAVAADSSGNVYVAGYTWSPDFPTTSGAYQQKYPNGEYPATANSNAFVAKLSASGSERVYSTYLGGSSNLYAGDVADGIAVDPSGDAYVVGWTYANNFPTQNAFQSDNKDYGKGKNAFVTKLIQPAQSYSFLLTWAVLVTRLAFRMTATSERR